jgi:hypothetical protein
MTIFPHSFYGTFSLSEPIQALGQTIEKGEEVGVHLSSFEGKLQTISLSYKKEPPLNFGFVALSPFDVNRLYAAIKDEADAIKKWVKSEEKAWKTPSKVK